MSWEIIKNSLEKAMSYPDYQALFSKHVEEKTSSGPNQEEDMVHYTMLNHTRSKRVDKRAKLSDATEELLRGITEKQTWLVITETWCGDAAQSVPYFNLIASKNENIELKVVLRDEHTDLMDLFLTNGGRSIPKLIMLNETNQKVLSDWGPRPAAAQDIYLDYKKDPRGRVYGDISIELQKWYTKDKGVALQEEVVALF